VVQPKKNQCCPSPLVFETQMRLMLPENSNGIIVTRKLCLHFRSTIEMLYRCAVIKTNSSWNTIMPCGCKHSTTIQGGLSILPCDFCLPSLQMNCWCPRLWRLFPSPFLYPFATTSTIASAQAFATNLETDFCHLS
jgi:hypothetical protein